VASTDAERSGRRPAPGRMGRLGAGILVALIVAGCLLQVALALRDRGEYGAVAGRVPDWCVPAATARALGLGQATLCPPPGPSRPGT
jgi:hypothetical protein